MFKKILLLILLFNCKEGKIPFLKLESESKKHPEIFLEYANKISIEDSFQEFPKFNISLISKDDKKCLYSTSIYFLNLDYGPKFGICFENSIQNENVFKEIFNPLDDALSYSGDLEFQGKTIFVERKSLTELSNDIYEFKTKKFFFGDEKFEKAILKKTGEVFENSFSISGFSGTKIESNYSLPYFSIFQSDIVYKLIFPYKKNIYLVLDISKSSEIILLVENFFNSIELKHKEIILNCSKPNLKLTEVFLGENEFIEWKENSETHSCIEDYKININKEKCLFFNTSKFYFAGSVKTLTEESFLSEGLVDKENFWKSIKSNTKIDLEFDDKKDSISIPNSFVTTQNQISYSYKLKDSFCIWIDLFGKENYCADPGIETEPIAEFFKEQCNPKDFILSELNPYGIRDNDKLNTEGKFLELQYTGINSCTPNGLSLNIGSKRNFLFFKEKIQPNDILVIGKNNFFKNLSKNISLDLDFWKFQDSILLKNYNTENLLFEGSKPNEEFISLDKNKNVYSFLIQNKKIIHHPFFNSNFLNPFLKSNHFMSPGQVNPSVQNNVSGKFSEIHWAGSYKNNTSITDDDFIEILPTGKGTLTLEINSKKYIFPVSSKDDFIVLAENNLTCFPNSKIIAAKDFSLKEEFTSINLYDSFENKIEISYSPQKKEGLNLTSLKKRYSFVYTGYKDIWKNSSEKKTIDLDSNCEGKVFASPNSSNEFASFLVEDENKKFKFINPISEINFNFLLRRYSYSPSYEFISPLERLGLENTILFQDENTSNSILYLEIVPSGTLNLLNRDGMYIEGVLANPTNDQNEWILICNRSRDTKDLSRYEIHDEGNFDELVPFLTRKGFSLPTGLNNFDFQGNNNLLNPNQCAYIIDPDANNISLKKMGSGTNLIFTVKESSTIGNGISSGEKLDLFLNQGVLKTHVHSFGNRYSHLPFTLSSNKDEIILLKTGLKGESESDYGIQKW